MLSRQQGYVCLLVLFIFTIKASAQSFNSTRIRSGPGPSDVAVGDFNGDGKLDFVVTNATANQITIFLNNGDGTFRDGGNFTFNSGLTPVGVVVADFNHDGKYDIATANNRQFANDGNGSVSIFFGNGDGTFQPQVEIPIPGGKPNSITTTSFDHGNIFPFGDGWLDIAVANDISNDIVILQNNRNGSFSVARRFSPIPGTPIGGISSGDFDNNGTKDLAFVTLGYKFNESFHSDALFVALFDGIFNYSPVFVSVVDHPFGTSTVNLNNDQRPDLIVTHTGTNPGAAVMLNNGGFANFSRVGLSAPGGTDQVSNKAVAADFNGDSFPDIAFAAASTASGGPIQTLVFTGTSSMQSWTAAAPIPGGTFSLVTGDVNADKKYDLIAVDAAVEFVYIDTNSSSATGCAPFAVQGAGFDLCQPANPNTNSPVRIQGSATLLDPVDHIEVWIDGKKADQIFGEHIDKSYNVPSGSHTIAVVSVDQEGKFETSNIPVQIGGSSGGGASTCPISSTPNTVTICSPRSGSTVTSPVHVTASASRGQFSITAMRLYVDNQPAFLSLGNTLDATVSLSGGTHFLVVIAYNQVGRAFASSEFFNVGSGGTTGQCATPGASPAINFCNPQNGAFVTSPVPVSLNIRWDGHTVSHVRIYVDDVPRFDRDFQSLIQTQIALPKGAHKMVVVVWDTRGAVFSATSIFAVR